MFTIDITLRHIYHKEKKIFKRKKPKRVGGKAGIPQGGVYSGLIANIYMHEFDKWVIGLKEKYDLKYILQFILCRLHII